MTRSAWLLAGACVCALSFLLVTLAAVTEWADRVDAVVAGLFTYTRVGPSVLGFTWLTALGTGSALGGLVLATTGLLWNDPARARLIRPLWLIYAGVIFCAYAVKYAAARARPPVLDGMVPMLSPSYPSAHAAGSVAVLGFVCCVVLAGLAAARARAVAMAAAVALTGLVALSRLVLGVHFATDVAGGLLLGGAVLLLGVYGAERRDRR